MNDGEISWSPEKNRILREERGVCFEDVEAAIESGNILADIAHPMNDKYPNQRMLVLLIEGYVFNVPYVLSEQGIFLKTLYASRKSKKIFLDRGNNEQN